jgi:hypothetical protein
VLSRAGDLIGRHLRARPEGAGGLVAVLEAGPPEALAAPIRSALAQKVSDDWAVLAQNQPPHTQPPADWRPTSAGQLRTALDLCRALEQVRPGLDGEWFRFFWRYLGACLARLQAEDLRRRFPQVWALTGRYAEVLGGDDLAAARLLLVPLARRGGEQFLSIFSHLGESLVAEGRVDDARRLAALRDDPQFAPCFFRDPPPDAVLQADREDLLRPILAVVPEAARSGNLVPDAARAALQNRGMWAALALASEPTTLAEVCGELCYAGGDGTGRSFHAEMLAVVLLGVLGRHGFGHADVHRLATGLIEGRFFSKLAEACPDDKDRQSVRAALISYLRDRRLPDERLFATVKAIKAAGF